MNEIFYQYSKARGLKYARSRAPLIVTLERSRENLTAMLRQFAQGTTWPIKRMSGPLTEQLPAEHIDGSRMTRSVNMSGAELSTVGRQNSLPGALRNFIRSSRSAMKPFTNGSMLMPEISSRHLSGQIEIANDEAIRGVIKRPTSPREYRSKNALKRFCCARNPVTGKQTRLSRVKAGQRPARCRARTGLGPGRERLSPDQ